MRLSQKKIMAVLRRYGYRLTPQRRAIIKTVVLSQDHVTPAAIYDKLHQGRPNIGLVTIYRTLEILTRLGLICQVHAGGGRSYIISASGHHHHLICSGCGLVVDFAGRNLAGLEQRLSRETGFKIEDHLLEFVGLCQDCQRDGV